MVHEAVDGRERHGLVWEDLAPFAEWLVGGNEHGAALVARADQLEEHAGLGLVLADIGDVVEDQQVILVEFRDGAFEREFPARHLQPLNEIGGAHEEYAPAVFDEPQADGGGQMALAGAGRNSVILPGIRVKVRVFFIHIIPAGEIRSSLFAASVSKAPTYLLFISPMGHSLIFHAG